MDILPAPGVSAPHRWPRIWVLQQNQSFDPWSFNWSALSDTPLLSPQARCHGRNGVHCNGWTRPRRVCDLTDSWYLVGRKYACRDKDCGTHFISYDERLLALLWKTHPGIAAGLGARISHKAALSEGVMDLLRCSIAGTTCSTSFEA